MVCALVLAGCTTVPQPAPFERCMAQVGKGMAYQGDELKAADWCASHNNGNIQ
jgi:hypothetical protein